MTNLRALGLSAFLAITTFGCAATSVVPEVPTSADAPIDSRDAVGPRSPMSWDVAARAFDAMSERCRHDRRDRSESALNHCIAATNLAATVLHDERRAEALLEYRCEAFGTRDVGNPLCPSDGGAREVRAEKLKLGTGAAPPRTPRRPGHCRSRSLPLPARPDAA
jgi:hypothetical protein